MTRDELLEYIKDTWGTELEQVGLRCLDTPESLYYVISDALRLGDTLEAVHEEAKRRVEQLLIDRRDAIEPPAEAEE